MKRLTALLLTAIMVFTIIPASFMSVSAHGRGVAQNNRDNLSIDNAPGQIIPSTVVVDGSEDDTGWDHDDWQTVNAGTGIWDAVYYRSSDFTYKYQLHSDYQYLYGIVKLDINDIYNGTLKDVTIWLNSDPSVKTYTAKLVFSASNVTKAGGTLTPTIYFNNGTTKAFDTLPAGNTAIEKSLYAVKNDNGVITVEFRCLTEVLCGAAQKAMTAYVSVGTHYAEGDVTQNLYHPRFDAEIDGTGIDPTKAWPANATEVTQREIYALPNADYSKVLPNEMVIDGKLEEGVWAPFTTMYTDDKDRFEYRDEGKFTPVDFGTVKYHHNLIGYFSDSITGTNETSSSVTGAPDSGNNDAPIKYKYDVRYDKNNLYGAVIAYADVNTLQPVKGGNEVSVYLTVRTSKLTSNGSAAVSGTEKNLYIKNTVGVSKPNSKYMMNEGTSTTSSIYFGSYSGSDVKDKAGITCGSYRTSDYLVEFEFCIPLTQLTDDGKAPDAGDLYGYILSVNTDKWTNHCQYGQINNPYVSSSERQGCSEISTTSSAWGGCTTYGNTFTKTTEVNTENWSANGVLEPGRWTAIKAADNKIDYGARNGNDGSHFINYLAQSNPKFSIEHMAYDLFVDSDYVYGIALIEDTNWTSGKAFNIWINNGAPRWGDWYDNRLAFSLDAYGNVLVDLRCHYIPSSEFYNGTENMFTGIYNAYANPADGIAALKSRGFRNLGSKTSLSKGNYGDKWLMHPTEAVNSQGVEAVFTTVKANTKLLEFKIPLEMLGVTETEESLSGSGDYAFTYGVSVSIVDGAQAGQGGNQKEMCHPMMSNREMKGLNQTDRTFYIGYYNANYDFSNGSWNSQETVVVNTAGNRYTNNVPDGKLQEAYWDTVDELIKVDGATGEWQAPPTSDDHVDYAYRVFTGREWLYGAAQINAAASANNTKFTIYFNNNGSATATGYMEVKLDENMEPVITIKAADGKTYNYSGFISDGSALHGDVSKAVVPFNETVYRYGLSASSYITGTQNYGYASMKTINGVTYVEFKINLDKYIINNSNKTAFKYNTTGSSGQWSQDKNIDNFYIEPREKLEYVVSVEQDKNVLFHGDGDAYQLWITGINPDSAVDLTGKWGGYIINQDIASHIKKDGWTYILMCPSELENVYKVEAMNWLADATDSASVAAWAEWTELKNHLHDGAILYKLIDVPGAAYPEHLQWSLNPGHEQTGMLDKILEAGKYVRFTNFNPLGSTAEEMFTQMGNKDIGYTLRGYATSATFEPFDFPGNDLNKVQNGVTQYPDKAWTFTTDYNVEPLKNFAPENIIVDGYLDDAGWAEDKWVHVSNDVNGNLQNPGDNVNTTTEFEYDYQIRTDGEYVYIAALMDREPDFDTATNGWNSSPQFRIWIQSQGEGYDYNGNGQIDANEKFDNAVSFTHLFDVRLGTDKDPNTGSTSSGGNIQSSITIDKYSYTKDNLSFNPLNAGCDIHLPSDDSVSVKDNGNGTLKLTFNGATMRFATHMNTAYTPWWQAPNGGNAQTDGTATTMDITGSRKFGQSSVFYGEQKTYFENTVPGVGNSYTSDSWYAQPEVTKYTYGKEHAAYNCTKDGNKTVVEFKFALEDIGTDSEHGFKYYVQCSSVGSTTSNAYVLFHPHYTVEPDNGNGAYSGYHLPFWVWGENAFYCDEQWFYDNMLNNPKKPVLPLGGQTVENYKNDKVQWSSAVRFGVLYDADYLDDVYGKTDWTGAENIYKDATYWDVKEIGLVLGVSQRLQLKGTDVELYTDTKYPGTNSKVNYVDSDTIIHRVDDTNMADYSSYIFYAVTNTSGHENDKLTFRGVVEYYPYDDIYYDHNIPTKLPNDQSGHSFRPTYYSNVLTRSYNMIKQGSQIYGNESNMPGLDRPIVQINKVDGYDKVKVAYIPLDNRPVNYQRVQYLAQSVGIDLLMPPEDLFKNTLDNNDTNPDNNTRSDSGNPLQLLNWLKNEASAASYYVLSLDMLFSGGLIGSRAAEVDKTYDDGMATYLDGVSEYTIGTVNATTGMYELSAGERAIIDYLADLAAREDKYVVYFDTVMRLASTTYYGNYVYDDYAALRGTGSSVTATNFGYAEKARLQLYGKDLTLANIFAGYNKDANDNVISTNGSHSFKSGNTTYTTDKIDEYLKNRKRKLTIIDTLLQTERNGKRTADNIDKLILGADDSSPQTTIQTNELRYLEEKLLGDNENVVVMAAADELGQLGISDVTTAIYGKVNVKVQYFGAGKDLAADDYDRGNLASTVKAHVKAAGGYYDYNHDNGLEVLILTRTDMTDGTKGYSSAEYTTLANNAKALVQKAQANINANIPTCIVDASDSKGEGTLSAYMFGTNFKGFSHVGSDVANYALSDVGLLMGYSEWNTVANALGVSLGNAIARYTYLQHSAVITEESNYGFMKNITHAFVKDIAYREFNNGADFYKYAPVITNKINASEIYVGEIGTNGSRVEPFTKVKVSDLYWPWDRSFEADFNITFTKGGNIAPNGSYEIPSASTGVWNEKTQSYEYAADTDRYGRFITSLTDGKAQNANYTSANDENWSRLVGYTFYGEGQSITEKNITFTFNDAIEAGYVRIHLLVPETGSVAGIQAPYAILVSGSNDKSTWEQIGAIEPTKTADYNMPDGNTNPGTYYPFWPESAYCGQAKDNPAVAMYSTWATVPLNSYAAEYKYIRIYLCGYGATYFNEVEIYEADSNYNSDWILSGEEVYGN